MTRQARTIHSSLGRVLWALVSAVLALGTAVFGSLPAAAAGTADGTGREYTLASDSSVKYYVPETVVAGEDITISGTGWTDTAGTTGSVIAVKLDEGAVSTTAQVTNPVDGLVQANKTIYALVQADSTGAWTATIPFPSKDNSTAEWAAGETHSIRFLTGSLLPGDTGRTASASFAVVAAPATEPGTPATTAPVVSTQPVDAAVTLGGTATLSAAATGTPAPSVQWERKPAGSDTWAAVDGATSTTLTVTVTALSQSGDRYRAVFTNEAGTVTTDAATLRVLNAQSVDHSGVATTPTSDGAVAYVPGSVVAGADITISGSGWTHTDGTRGSVIAVKVDNLSTTDTVTNPATGVVIPNKTVLAAVQADADGEWTLTLPWPASAGWESGSEHTVTLLTGSMLSGDVSRSVAATFTVATDEDDTPESVAPEVTTQPRDVSVWTGATATFSAAASGTPTPTVQWETRAAGSTSWTAIDTGTSTTLSVPVTSADRSGDQYRAVFTNEAGSVTTDVATLTVAGPVPTDPVEHVGREYTLAGDPSVKYFVPETVGAGEDITISGTGWTDTAGTTGSVIAVKLDEGAVSTTGQVTNPATGVVQGNKTIYAMVQADSAGAWTATFPFPTTENSTAEWAVGETHSIRLLTGSMLAGDVTRSAGGVDAGAFTVVKEPVTEPDWSHQTVTAAGATSGDVAIAWVEDEVPTATATTIRLRGTGWLTTEGRPSTVAIKLSSGGTNYYSRSGSGVIDHPSAPGDDTIWVLLAGSNPTGNPNVRTIDADGSFDTTIDLPAGLTAGQYLTATFLSGRFDPTDVQRSVTTGYLTVGGVAYVPDDGTGTDVTCVASSAQPTVTIENPTVSLGGVLQLSGTGWCHPAEDKGGSVIAVKIDEGAYSHVPGRTVSSNATIWAIIDDVDPATGDWTAEITLPDGTTGTSTPAFTTGAHTLRLLTGSLKAGDETRTVLSAEFVVGTYKPNTAPEPIEATEGLTAATKGGLSVTRTSTSLTVTVPGAEKGDWVFLSTYDADGNPSYPWGGTWFRADSSGRVKASLTGVTLATGTLKLVAQSGNQGELGTLLGWTTIQGSTAVRVPVPTPGRTTTPTTAPTTAPATSTSITRTSVVNLVSSTTVDVTRPTTTPDAPFPSDSGLTADNAGSITSTQEDTVVTLTLPDREPGEWVFIYAYSDPVAVGWIQVDANRQVRVDLKGLPGGDHKVAVLDRAGQLIGWSAATLDEEETEATSSEDSTSADSGSQAAAPVTAALVTEGSTGLLGATDWWLLGGAGLVMVVVLTAAGVARGKRLAPARTEA